MKLILRKSAAIVLWIGAAIGFGATILNALKLQPLEILGAGLGIAVLFAIGFPLWFSETDLSRKG